MGGGWGWGRERVGNGNKGRESEVSRLKTWTNDVACLVIRTTKALAREADGDGNDVSRVGFYPPPVTRTAMVRRDINCYEKRRGLFRGWEERGCEWLYTPSSPRGKFEFALRHPRSGRGDERSSFFSVKYIYSEHEK